MMTPAPRAILPPLLQRATVLVVTAHPDDESYATAGTLYEINRSGGTVHLICATRGERGTSHLRRRTSARQLTAIRSRELQRACRILKIRSVRLLDLPDGRVAAHRAELFPVLLRIARIRKPNIVLGFGPDGISGHRDHIAVGAVARRVARSLRIQFIRFTLPPRITRQAESFLRTRRRSPHYVKRVRYDRPDFVIQIRRSVKERALRCHASQLDGRNAFTGFPTFAVRELLRSEYLIAEPAETER